MFLPKSRSSSNTPSEAHKIPDRKRYTMSSGATATSHSTSSSSGPQGETRMRGTGRGGVGNIMRTEFDNNSIRDNFIALAPLTGREIDPGISSRNTTGRTGKGNITHTREVTHPLPLRSSEVIKQHAISEAEYEFELIRQSTEERHRRMKRPSGRGGVGNSYLYTPSKSPKFSVFGARAVSPQTSPSIVAQSTAFQHRSPGAPTNAPQDERRTWLKLRLGRRLERKECPIQTYTGVTPVTRTSVLDISPIKSYPRQSLATLDIRAYDNPDDMHGDPISPEFSEDGCSNRHSYNFRPRQRSHSIASSTVSITGYDHDPAEFSHHRLAEFVRSMNTTPTLPLYRLDASSDPTLPLSTRASAGSSSAGYTRIGTHLLVEDHNEDGAITYEAEDDTDGENGSDFEAGASLYASSFPIHASALASVPNSTPNSTASSPIISPPDPYPFPNSTSPILRNVPIRRNPEQSRIVRRKRHFGLTPVA